MKVIKRNGEEVQFDIEKIKNAIRKASDDCEDVYDRLYEEQIDDIADYVEYQCSRLGRAPTVEEIQDKVENGIMSQGKFNLAKKYIRYRHDRELARHANTTDASILSLIDCTNENVKQENSNKNPAIVSVQRDYMAGEVSKDLTNRVLLPKDVVEAHEKGIIHFHDADYFAQRMHNCGLYNLDDMLQNGTVISGTKIEKPNSFATACNIATQAIAQIASVSYGKTTVVKRC